MGSFDALRGGDRGDFETTGPSGALPRGAVVRLEPRSNEPGLAAAASWFALSDRSDGAHPATVGSVPVDLTGARG
jgi:hypothetical protein